MRFQRRATTHKDWKSIAKACAGDGTDSRCPQTATSSTSFGTFVEPVVRGPSTIELVFPAESFRATSQDVWRLEWDGGAWRLVAIDWLARQAGEEGSE